MLLAGDGAVDAAGGFGTRADGVAMPDYPGNGPR
jgi:hypothetical protein